MALAAVGGEDQQEEQGRPQHHLEGGEEVVVSVTAVYTVAGSWTIETPGGCLSFALAGALDNYSA